MTFRTTAISAGVIRVMPMAAFITLKNMAAHNIGTALEYICKCETLTWQHFFAEFVQILISVATEDVRHFQHDHSTKTLMIGHEIIYLAVHFCHCALRQMHVDKCCLEALMPKQSLDYSKVDTFLQQMRGI